MSVLQHIAIDQLIASMYEQSVANKTLHWDRPNVAQHFAVNMNVYHTGYIGDVYHENYDRKAVCVMHVIITGRHRVYIADTRHIQDVTAVPPARFINTSNHDSCWKTDGLAPIQRKFFDMSAYVGAAFEENERPTPAALHKHSGLGDWLMRNPLSFVRVEFGPKREDNDNFNTLTSVKALTFKLTVGETDAKL